jgi:hypothetical protein
MSLFEKELYKVFIYTMLVGIYRTQADWLTQHYGITVAAQQWTFTTFP